MSPLVVVCVNDKAYIMQQDPLLAILVMSPWEGEQQKLNYGMHVSNHRLRIIQGNNGPQS